MEKSQPQNVHGEGRKLLDHSKEESVTRNVPDSYEALHTANDTGSKTRLSTGEADGSGESDEDESRMRELGRHATALIDDMLQNLQTIQLTPDATLADREISSHGCVTPPPTVVGSSHSTEDMPSRLSSSEDTAQPARPHSVEDTKQSTGLYLPKDVVQPPQTESGAANFSTQEGQTATLPELLPSTGEKTQKRQPPKWTAPPPPPGGALRSKRKHANMSTTTKSPLGSPSAEDPFSACKHSSGEEVDVVACIDPGKGNEPAVNASESVPVSGKAQVSEEVRVTENFSDEAVGNAQERSAAFAVGSLESPPSADITSARLPGSRDVTSSSLPVSPQSLVSPSSLTEEMADCEWAKVKTFRNLSAPHSVH